MSRPLAIDLCAGLGGWAEGLLAEGWEVVGFDIERHVYGEHRYPGQLVLQDVLTLDGAQFRDADLLVASPPCQFFSYTAMPWSRAKALAAEVRADPARLDAELALFRACFRLQREACAAAGRHIPLIVENVRGAIPWVGRSRWNFGSFHLWGDVPALMPPTGNRLKGGDVGWRERGPGRQLQDHFAAFISSGMNWSDRTRRGQDFTRIAGQQPDFVKTPGAPHIRDGESHTRHLTNPGEHGIKQHGSGAAWWDKALDERRKEATEIKNGGDWFNSEQRSEQRRHWSTSPGRKAASALIARIPFPLATYIAKVFQP